MTAEELVNEIIVAAAGGPRRLARLIGKSAPAVIQWKERGSIPQIVRGRLIEEIRKRDAVVSDAAMRYLCSGARGKPES